MIAGAGPGPDGNNETWSAAVAAERYLGEHGVGQGATAAPEQPRMEFVGAESLTALAAEHTAKVKAAGLPPCKECENRKHTIESRETIIKALEQKLAFMVEAAEAEAVVRAQASVPAQVARLMDIIARIQATDRVQRRNIAAAESRSAQLAAYIRGIGREVPQHEAGWWTGDVQP